MGGFHSHCYLNEEKKEMGVIVYHNEDETGFSLTSP